MDASSSTISEKKGRERGRGLRSAQKSGSVNYNKSPKCKEL